MLVGFFTKIRLLMKFFLSIFSCLLVLFSVVSCPLCVLADTQGGDSVSIGIDFSSTSSTGSETVNSYLWGEFVSEWMDEDDTTFTVYDFMSRLADAYVSFQYAVPSGGATLVKNAIFDTMRDYTFYVDSQTGVVKAPPEFYNDLRDIYERFGFDEVDQLIGYWHALPFESGNTRVYSSQTVYYTKVTGSGGSRILFAFRGSPASVTTQYIASGVTNSYNLDQNYTGTEYSGVWRQGTNTAFNNAISTYFTDNDWATYSDNNISVAQDNALAAFFGDTEPSGGTVWNGRLYYDDTPNAFTLNNARGGITDAANRYSLLNFLDVQPDDTNLHQYFDGDTTIIYNPNFSDIPNTHDFSYELPSGSIPELDFEFNYTLEADQGGSFFNMFDGVFNSSGTVFFICIVVMGVFLLVEVMT